MKLFRSPLIAYSLPHRPRRSPRKTRFATVTEAILKAYGIEHVEFVNHRRPGGGRRFTVYLNYAGRSLPAGADTARIATDGGIETVLTRGLRDAGFKVVSVVPARTLIRVCALHVVVLADA
jgi:hypothetical protein